MPIERLFTSNGADFHDPSTFVPHAIEKAGATLLNVYVPPNWSNEAAQAFASALFPAVPSALRPVEENTMPSWLWRKRSTAVKGTDSETGAHQVFHRVAGAAVYAAWKKGLVRTEAEASAFYDELHFMLTERILVLDPSQLGRIGTDWAYHTSPSPGYPPSPVPEVSFEQADLSGPELTAAFSIRNETIDTLLSSNNAKTHRAWDRLLDVTPDREFLKVSFADTIAEWGSSPAPAAAPRLMLDLMRFRRPDASFDVIAFRHAVRLAVFLLDMHYEQMIPAPDPARALSIGYGNLAALLMSMAIPYDSKVGRATAAAISAIMTAEAVAASAELAGLLGPCLSYSNEREMRLRALRNHRRAAYDERTDYEHLSILPVPLNIGADADLVLIATARRRWDEALELVQQHGLRHLQLTALFAAPVFAPLMDCSAQGIEAERTLVRQCSLAPDLYRREIHPAVPLALDKLGCDPSDVKGIIDFAIGYNTLKAAPGVNHALLYERGFDAAAIARVEEYLPRVNDIRHAFTPWILGEEFCRARLDLSKDDCQNPRFDLLRHLSFSEEDIRAADAFCCGNGTVAGASELPADAREIFALEDVSASLRMAAAVQSFIMGDINLVVGVSASQAKDEREKTILAAWRQGVKSIALFAEGAAMPQKAHAAALASRRKMLKRATVAPIPEAMPRLARKKALAHITSSRAAKPKATSREVSLKRGGTKTAPHTGTKRN